MLLFFSLFHIFYFFICEKIEKFTKNLKTFRKIPITADWHTHITWRIPFIKIDQLDLTKKNWIKNNKTFGTNSDCQYQKCWNRKSNPDKSVTFKGGWSWAWNHGGAWPSRWAPWQQPQSGPPSTGRGSSSNNRGAGPSWANSSSQRSWHPRQAANKYNSRWETNKQTKPISTKEIFSLSQLSFNFIL